MVPPSHGTWLVGSPRVANEHHYADEGHLSIFANHFDEIAAALARMDCVMTRTRS